MFYNKSYIQLNIRIVFYVILAFLAVTSSAGASTKVPNFSFPSVVDNKTIDIRDFRGKIVLVNFWATWCGPCIKEIPSLIKLQEEFGHQDFSVIGISVDQGGKRGVENVVKKMGVTYPIVIGNSKVSRQFGGVFGVPTSFLIDRSGNVIKKYPGYIGHQIFVDDIKTAIK